MVSAVGSSPLTRGTPRPMPVYSVPGRFIPAYAGNSVVRIPFLLRAIGSSPLTRGTLLEKNQKAWNQSVHPRLRGELVEKPYQKQKLKRFIPAYAGNSNNQSCRNLSSTVHPRLRGELSFITNGSEMRIGSSPLTRGTLLLVLLFLGTSRFIPAYAGNSS